MVSILDPITSKQGDSYKSISWYRGKIAGLSNKPTAGRLLNSGDLLSRPSAGRLNMFLYNPKTKKRLPYYDVFPLVLPLDTIPGGFIGCNFHYLPPALRLRFLESLQAYQTAANLKTRTKFDVSYDKLKGTTRLDVTYDDLKKNRYTKPTIKKYLYSQAQSQFLRININEAALAVLLPVAQFRKESNRTVYKDSRAML